MLTQPENILLKDDHIKLCDFGFATILAEKKTLCGTYEYMSPEMICNSSSYNYKIDIWALGILYFELLAGHAPFKGKTPEEVYNKMQTNLYFPQHFSTSYLIQLNTISISSDSSSNSNLSNAHLQTKLLLCYKLKKKNIKKNLFLQPTTQTGRAQKLHSFQKNKKRPRQKLVWKRTEP